MKLTNRQTNLLHFVKEQHGDQKRKYTLAPYWTHLMSVAELVSEYPDIEMGVEIALCHDLAEDTKCKFYQLNEFLLNNGYGSETERHVILRDVTHLTDVFTSEAYPALNRAARKSEEAQRLISISPNAQSVKYADIIDNTSSIVKHDPGFAKVYLKEIEGKIPKMDKGNPELYARCLDVFDKAVKQLEL